MSAMELDAEQYVAMVAETTGVERIQHIIRLMDLLDSIDTTTQEGYEGYVAIVEQCKAVGLAQELRAQAERRNAEQVKQQQILDSMFGAAEIERQRQRANVVAATRAIAPLDKRRDTRWPCGAVRRGWRMRVLDDIGKVGRALGARGFPVSDVVSVSPEVAQLLDDKRTDYLLDGEAKVAMGGIEAVVSGSDDRPGLFAKWGGQEIHGGYLDEF